MLIEHDHGGHFPEFQVLLTTSLRSRSDPSVRLCVATTHLKARNGALLSTLRNEQGKDIVQFLSDITEGDPADTAVVLTGDFNAEPTEPVFTTVTGSKLGYIQTTDITLSKSGWGMHERVSFISRSSPDL